MKKLKYILFFNLFVLILNISNVYATNFVTENDLKEKFPDATYFCYYNSSGLLNGEYEVIVGLSPDKKNGYAYTSKAKDEKILNWNPDSEGYWDDPAEKLQFSAYEYYLENGTCPPIAFERNQGSAGGSYYYLIENRHYSKLRDILENTFFYNHQSTKIFILAEEITDNETYKECKYQYKAYESSQDKKDGVSDEKKYNIDVTLKYNKSGKILNIIDFNNKVELSNEIITSTNASESDICPNLYLCYVTDYVASNDLGYRDEIYKYRLYYADMTLDNINEVQSCEKISCYNTDNKSCSPESLDSEYCNSYSVFYGEYESALEEYKKCKSNGCDISVIKNYNNSKTTITNWCTVVLQNLNADNPCTKKCLEVKNIILTEEKNAGINSYGTGDCGLSARLIVWISNILRWVKYILPVAVIILGILDFIKAIGTDKDDEMKKAQQRFIRRLISAALVFLIPLILEFVLDKMGFGYDSCSLF